MESQMHLKSIKRALWAAVALLGVSIGSDATIRLRIERIVDRDENKSVRPGMAKEGDRVEFPLGASGPANISLGERGYIENTRGEQIARVRIVQMVGDIKGQAELIELRSQRSVAIGDTLVLGQESPPCKVDWVWQAIDGEEEESDAPSKPPDVRRFRIGKGTSLPFRVEGNLPWGARLALKIKRGASWGPQYFLDGDKRRITLGAGTTWPRAVRINVQDVLVLRIEVVTSYGSQRRKVVAKSKELGIRVVPTGGERR